MTSMLCVKQPGGNVKIHDKDLIEDLCSTDSEKHILCKRYGVRSGRKSGSHSSISDAKRQHSIREENDILGNTIKVKDWLSAKSVEQLQERSDAEAINAKKLYSPLLETERTFVQDVSNYLKCENLLNLRKKELLHKRWSDHVYEPLRREIIRVMDGDRWRDTDRRKRVLHKQYLEFVNEKGHIFLETINPKEYYAQSLSGFRPAPIKIEVNRLRDPLTSQGRQRNHEDQTILQCITGHKFTDSDIEQIRLPLEPLVPLGRQDGNSISWLRMPFCDIESPTRQASRVKVRGYQSKSSLDLDNWLNASVNRDIVDKEWKIQKKRMYAVTPPFDMPPMKVEHADGVVENKDANQSLPAQG